MPCLGHLISHSASISDDYNDARKKCWAALHRNLHAGLFTTPVATRVSFIKTHVLPTIAYRWARWPYSATLAKTLDGLQHQLLSRLVRPAAFPGEPPADYLRRSRAFVGRLQTMTGRWSQLWAVAVKSWGSHCVRSPDEGNWCKRLLACQDSDWIQARRNEVASCTWLGRTGTRAAAGAPTTRWQAGVEAATAVDAPKRATTREVSLYIASQFVVV